MSKRVLLAGCGDLGLRVARLLLARGDEVWGLRRHPPGGDGPIRWIAADLAQPHSLARLPEGIDQLIYLPTPDRRDEAAYRSTFVAGLQNLLEAPGLASLRRALLVSSSAVHGEHGGAWIDETTAPDPPGFNGRVLCEAERLLWTRAADPIVLRLAGLYGPGRTQLLEGLRRGELRVPRAQPHWANRIHVDDAAAAIAHLLHRDAPQPLYLGVDDTPLPLHVLYDHLCDLLGAPRAAEGPAPAGVGSKRLDNARLRASGFVPRWPDARVGYAALITSPTSTENDHGKHHRA